MKKLSILLLGLLLVSCSDDVISPVEADDFVRHNIPYSESIIESVRVNGRVTCFVSRNEYSNEIEAMSCLKN